MLFRCRGSFFAMATVILAIGLSGCTSFSQYVRNGFKVGPNYCRRPAPVAEHWIDQADIRAESNPETLCRWWMVLGDPKLNELILCAYRQNLTLKEAGFRVLQSRANLDIAVGNLFPQQQSAFGDFRRSATATDPNNPAPISRFSERWNYGFNLNWELDFWGRFRRAVTSADRTLDASVAEYDGVLVTLFADIAQNYVQVRTSQQRIVLLKANVALQQGVCNYINTRFQAGKVSKLDLDQAESNLKQTEAAIPQLEIELRQAENRLCTLLGMPTVALSNMLGEAPIPTCPPEVVIGMPAELLRSRPDVRRAERLAAAQAEKIGIAEADLYPAFSISGTLGYQANDFPDLFRYSAFNGSIGPSFQWNLLNYGRIVNNMRAQDAKFQELVVAYQNTVLKANEEVENGLATFLRAQRRSKLLDESVVAARSAVDIVIAQYEQGAVDFNRYAVIQQNLVTQQDTSAQARGQIAQGLIAIYRALGGGWEIRLGNMPPPGPMPNAIPNGQEGAELIPAPQPEGPANAPASPSTEPPSAVPFPPDEPVK